jgi:transposase
LLDIIAILCYTYRYPNERISMAHIPEGDRMQSRIMCLDDMVAKEAMVRVIDRFISVVDLVALGFENTTPSTRGRNSYSPKTLAKLYVFCYLEGIRSSRRIEKACQANIEVMWLTGDLRPDFKTIADFRRDNIDALTALFYEFSSFLDSVGLYGKKTVAIDGTKIRASNSKRRNISKKSLKRRIEHHEAKVAQFLQEMEKEDDLDTLEELADKAKEAQRRADEAEAFLDDMDEADIAEVSLTDPDARCMGKGRQGMQVAYNIQAAVDAKHHLFAGFAITNRPDDHGQLSNMALFVQETMRKRGITFLADKGYWGARDLNECKEADIACIVSPQKKSGAKKNATTPTQIYTDYDSR